jgi:hypothetical protein
MALQTNGYPSIDAFRESLGIPKSKVAEILGLSWEATNRKLTGQVEFNLTEVLALADWWGVSIDELVGRKVPVHPILRMGSAR